MAVDGCSLHWPGHQHVGNREYLECGGKSQPPLSHHRRFQDSVKMVLGEDDGVSVVEVDMAVSVVSLQVISKLRGV